MFRTIGRYRIDVALPLWAMFFFFLSFFFFFIKLLPAWAARSKSQRGWAFRNTKKAGRSEKRVREKVGSLVGQRRCCSFPSSGLRHPCASLPPRPSPTRARTPTLVRSLAGTREDMRRVCAHVRVMRTGVYACVYACVRMCVCYNVRTWPPTRPPT